MHKIKEGFNQMFSQASEKKQVVSEVFSSVFKKYDAMNDAMSFGLHRFWKKTFADSIILRDGMQILDLSSGSGDIALLILKKAQKMGLNINITISDFNPDMLSLAQDRNEFKQFADKITFLQIDGCKMIKAQSNNQNEGNFAFVDEASFDIITCSFGIRNFYDVNQGLAQINLALKPNGTFYCLEFSPPCDSCFKDIYSFYSNKILPKVGKFIAGDEESYIYLAKSIENFLTPSQFVSQMQHCGYKNSFYNPIFKDLVAMYCGSKA